MNFYAFNIGDYSKKTRHLSWDEDMAYRRLIDAYYTREGALPADVKQVYRLVMATSRAQRLAVDAVLQEFFILCDEGFKQPRCDQEIVVAKAKREKASASASQRWDKAKAQETQSERTADVMRSHSEGNAPNPIPIPNPSKGDGIGRERANWDQLRDKLAEAAGWQAARANGKLEVVGPIVALIEAGCDLELDVLPVIRRDAPRIRSPNWTYFLNGIAQARDDRLAASTLKTEGQPHADHFRSGAGRNTIAGSSSTVDAIIDAERRAIAAEAAAIGLDLESEGPSDRSPETLPRLRQVTA